MANRFHVSVPLSMSDRSLASGVLLLSAPIRQVVAGPASKSTRRIRPVELVGSPSARGTFEPVAETLERFGHCGACIDAHATAYPEVFQRCTNHLAVLYQLFSRLARSVTHNPLIKFSMFRLIFASLLARKIRSSLLAFLTRTMAVSH